MRGYAVQRLLEMALVLLGMSVLVFLMIHLIPGDPALLIAGMEASPETLERIRRDLELDQPLYLQFGSFLRRALGGDLGTSIRTGSPVAEEIAERFPYTVRIAVGASLLATLLGMASGVLAAVYHNRPADALLTVLSLLAASTPSYWLALMLMLVFSLSLNLLPAIGVGTPLHYLLPVATLGAQSGGMIARMTRAAMLDVLGQSYIGAARARGLAEHVVIVKHALGNALIPVVSLVGLRLGSLLAGTVLVESVFAIPGVGRMLVDAVLARDYPVVQGGVLVLATVFVVINTLTDLLYGIIDPRIRVA
jgi:ABC-type dipeptide/oligopeptide/nickel transport system permease component